MTDTRTAVELAIPSMLFLVVARDTCFSCFDSLGRVTDTAGYLKPGYPTSPLTTEFLSLDSTA